MIDRVEALDINGVRQWLLIRGERVDAPIILFVHGGPASPLMYFSRAMDHHLLKDFTVVHWDQRGAGKSYAPDIPEETFSIEQFARDGIAVVGQLRSQWPRGSEFFALGCSGLFCSGSFRHRNSDVTCSRVL